MSEQPTISQDVPSGGTPEITVAICTYDRYPLLRKLVTALEGQTLPRSAFEVLVVDNTPDQAARKRFASEVRGLAGVKVLFSSPPGLSRARNLALEKCRSEYIAFIDDDALPDPGWLAAILAAFGQSGAAAVAGPIRPIWPKPPPHWLPPKYVGCLAVLDHGPEDRWLSKSEFAYGTNMAFKADALRGVGGFNVGLGRIGGRTLISDEEIEVQVALRESRHKVFYAAGATVSHLVHENRLSRNYFRARMAWQAVSTLMHDSNLWWPEQSRQELARASAELGVSELLEQLFKRKDAAAVSAQIDFLYHFLLLLLDSKDRDDDAFESQFVPAPAVATNSPTVRDVTTGEKAASHTYRPTGVIGPHTRHLFVEGRAGHAFLLDTYGGIPGSQSLMIPANIWEDCAEDLRFVENALTGQLHTLTFVTAEPFIYGPSLREFIHMLDRVKIPVFGIVHRLPWTSEHACALREAAARMRGVLVLAEGMKERLVSRYGIPKVSYLPLHPSHHLYMGRENGHVRDRIGVSPGQTVFAVLGEARKGKGIDFLLAALKRVPPRDRQNMFFLFAGRSKDVDPRSVTGALDATGCHGYVDLRQSIDPLNYEVLTEREFGEYANACDCGILLYQDDQKNCMSGVLPDYVWGRKPVIATADSIVGEMVGKHDLGMLVGQETPKAAASVLTAALRTCREGFVPSERYETFRGTIAPENVLRDFSRILDVSGTCDLVRGDDFRNRSSVR